MTTPDNAEETSTHAPSANSSPSPSRPQQHESVAGPHGPTDELLPPLFIKDAASLSLTPPRTTAQASLITPSPSRDPSSSSSPQRRGIKFPKPDPDNPVPPGARSVFSYPQEFKSPHMKPNGELPMEMIDGRPVYYAEWITMEKNQKPKDLGNAEEDKGEKVFLVPSPSNFCASKPTPCSSPTLARKKKAKYKGRTQLIDYDDLQGLHDSREEVLRQVVPRKRKRSKSEEQEDADFGPARSSAAYGAKAPISTIASPPRKKQAPPRPAVSGSNPVGASGNNASTMKKRSPSKYWEYISVSSGTEHEASSLQLPMKRKCSARERKDEPFYRLSPQAYELRTPSSRTRLSSMRAAPAVDEKRSKRQPIAPLSVRSSRQKSNAGKPVKPNRAYIPMKRPPTWDPRETAFNIFCQEKPFVPRGLRVPRSLRKNSAKPSPSAYIINKQPPIPFPQLPNAGEEKKEAHIKEDVYDNGRSLNVNGGVHNHSPRKAAVSAKEKLRNAIVMENEHEDSLRPSKASKANTKEESKSIDQREVLKVKIQMTWADLEPIPPPHEEQEEHQVRH
jgi:hypothetical protein